MLVLFGFIAGLYWAFVISPKKDSGIPPLPPIGPGNHFPASSTTYDRPYPLLDRNPVEFAWPSDALPWRHEPLKQMLVLDNKHEGCLELGSTDADHFSIEVELSKATWNSGHAGIFWGLHAIATDEAKIEIQWEAACFAVESTVFDQTHYFRLSLSRLSMFRRDGLIWFGTDTLGQVDIIPPDGSAVRIHLDIGRSGPFQVIWNGQRIDKIRSRK